MILSRILYPKKEICNEKEMYFRGYGFSIEENGKIKICQGGKIDTSTYFNGFSLCKWLDNTIVDNVYVDIVLSGNILVTLKNIYEENGELITKTQESIEFSSEKKKNVKLYFKDVKGIGFFELESLSDDSFFYEATYNTDLKGKSTNNVKIAIGICTFKREEFIIANLDNLQRAFDDPNSVLFNNADVYVADNGKTLPIEKYKKNIKIFYNNNFGGAGGFTRSLLEAYKSGKEYTNFIFMDDDIVLDVNAVEKTFIFLSLLKKEKMSCAIGGAMFSTDKRYLQFENGAKWQDSGFKFNMRDVDMRIIKNIVHNEAGFDINYNAWCYCCIPFAVVNENNLPLPIFFHMDDVEYGLRNNFKVITLNGINVWHLYKKALSSPKNDYYDVRNKLIMISELDPKQVTRWVHVYLASFTLEFLKYHYAKAINAFDGMLDFVKGFNYFKHIPTEKKHKELLNNVKWIDTSDRDLKEVVFSKVDPPKSKEFKTKYLIKQLFTPTSGEIAVYNNNSIVETTGIKEVKIVNIDEKKMITYRKDWKSLLKCVEKWARIKLLLRKNIFEEVAYEYHKNINDVQNLSFWNNYLGLESNVHYRLKVLFVASDNDSTSGAFRSMVVLASLLKKKGVYVHILLPKIGDGLAFVKQNGLRYTIIDSVDWIVPCNSSFEVIKEKKNLIKVNNNKAIKAIESLINREKFDFVHINTSYSYVAAVAAEKCKVPFIWHIREFLEEDQNRQMINKKYALSLMNKSKAIVAISNSIYEKYERLLDRNKLHVIYNGIDSGVFYRESHELFSEEKIVIIAVGVLADYKGQHLIIEACNKIKKNGLFPFKVMFVGNDKTEYADYVKSLVKEYELESDVEFLGRRNDTQDLYAKADIACVCSRSEAFGRITVEAMLSGCLLIGANTAGTKEIVRDQIDGYLFEEGNVDDLVNKLVSAVDNKNISTQTAKTGQKRARDVFSAQRNANDVYNLYLSLSNR